MRRNVATIVNHTINEDVDDPTHVFVLVVCEYHRGQIGGETHVLSSFDERKPGSIAVATRLLEAAIEELKSGNKRTMQ